MESKPPIKVLNVVTVPMSLRFFTGQAAWFRERGIELTFACGPGKLADEFAKAEGVKVHAIPILRSVSPIGDIKALWNLIATIALERPDILHCHTPKGGLIGTVAGRLMGVRSVVYHFRGLPLETATGLPRAALAISETVSCITAHRILAVSKSLRRKVEDFGINCGKTIEVLGHGSGNGVDSEGRFRLPSLSQQRSARQSLKLNHEDAVIGFVGRLGSEKGVVELATAWREIRGKFPRARLLLVGPVDERQPPPEATLEYLSDSQNGILHLPHSERVEDALATMDILVLPTYREGLPNTLLEAGAMGLPVVATKVTGCTDVVVDGETGTLVPPRDSSALAFAITKYLSDPSLRKKHGANARARVEKEFSRERVWSLLEAEYRKLQSVARLRSVANSNRREASKRWMDVAVSSVGILAISPVYLGVACAVRAVLGRPVLFTQDRPGKDGRIFKMVKFRTMSQQTDREGNLLPDKFRLGRFGKFLRAASLDELPELFNVLNGDMSLVGPRPLLTKYLRLYNAEQMRRHEKRPGITGLAQISGRNGLAWSEKFALDVWYVDNQSMRMDLSILIRTFFSVIRRDGIAGDGVVTATEFLGTPGVTP